MFCLIKTNNANTISMGPNSDIFSVMTIDGLHYIKSVVSDNPYELTLLCDTLWEGEVFEVPATVVHQGREYTVTGIDAGKSTKLKCLRELRIPPTVRHIFPEACVGIKSLRKVNIPDHCHVYAEAFAECGIEELILGEHVILEDGCFDGIRAKQVNIPETTKWDSYRGEAILVLDGGAPRKAEDCECDSYFEFSPVSAESMDDFIGDIFRYSIWHYMELLKRARKGDEWAKREFASGISSMNFVISLIQDESLYKPPFSPDEILSHLDENEKHWISQFEENEKRIMNMRRGLFDDDDLPF